jgi:opacity protein-like surface antigen
MPLRFSAIFLAVSSLITASTAFADSYPTGLPNNWNESSTPPMNLLAPKATPAQASAHATTAEPSVYAQNTVEANSATPSLRPLITVGAGIAFTNSVGDSEYFAETGEPGVTEYYDYSPKGDTQNKGLIDLLVGAEWAFNPNWALQAGLGYNQVGTYTAKGTLSQGFVGLGSPEVYSYQYNIALQSLLVEGKVLYTLNQNPHLHPYVSFALGGARNKAYAFETSVNPQETSTRNYQGNAKNSFTYAAGLGLDVDVTKHTRVGLGYRYADLGRVELGDANVNGVPVSGTIDQRRLHANEALAQFTYLF